MRAGSLNNLPFALLWLRAVAEMSAAKMVAGSLEERVVWVAAVGVLLESVLALRPFLGEARLLLEVVWTLELEQAAPVSYSQWAPWVLSEVPLTLLSFLRMEVRREPRKCNVGKLPSEGLPSVSISQSFWPTSTLSSSETNHWVMVPDSVAFTATSI
jgi:hypothetical protein